MSKGRSRIKGAEMSVLHQYEDLQCKCYNTCYTADTSCMHIYATAGAPSGSGCKERSVVILDKPGSCVSVCNPFLGSKNGGDVAPTAVRATSIRD